MCMACVWLDSQRAEGRRWDNDESFPRWWMRQAGVAMIVFSQSDFGRYGFSSPGHASPRAEILVLHESDDASELDGEARGACLDAPGVRVRLTAGWNGERPCDCRPLERDGRSFLHCRAGG